MYVILVVGSSRQGKSPFIKNYVRGSNLLVLDVQNEYGKRTKYGVGIPENLSTDNTKARSRFTKIVPELFIAECKKKTKTICVFEEATIFFQGSTAQPMRELIFSKAHTGNIYILVFHSINSIPPRIMEGTDFVVLFKTADVASKVKNKFPDLLPYYLKLRNAKDGTNYKIKIS